MDSEKTDAAVVASIENGGLTNENGDVSDSLNGATGEVLDTATGNPIENSGSGSDFDISEQPKDTRVENANDEKHTGEQKAQGKFKGENLSGGKNVSSVSVTKKKNNEKSIEAKVAASNGSAAPNTHTTNDLKNKSFDDKRAHATKHGKHDAAPTEVTGDKTKMKPLKKQSHDTSEGESESSNPTAEDGKSRRAGALPNYGFSFRCDQRAEKRREFYSKLEEKIHAKELEKSNMQAKSKETQEAEIKMLRKSLNFKATPMPTFYQEPQPPKVELKKIPPTKPKSPKLGRKKTVSATDSEETTDHTPRIGRLSLDEKGSKHNQVEKDALPVKPPLRKSLPKLPSQKTSLSNGGKPAPAKATTNSMKAKPEKDADSTSDHQDQAPTTMEAESAVSLQPVAAEH
ncbi:PREDICTED: protein WVD2-like 5 isoform X2 [Tarenaya hassleriana]|uniref:protein WVD2-like 5 isoform X2 n=1 Tax=Tarenaya hassleriana TaxID=28532 RepID=UPI00053C9C91|nr:PREDICTED: protein WVD2-like 5 isoform X2 [Tarenaya hassleriana]